MFCKDVHHSPCHDLILNIPIAPPTSEFCMSVTLVLLEIQSKYIQRIECFLSNHNNTRVSKISIYWFENDCRRYKHKNMKIPRGFLPL